MRTHVRSSELETSPTPLLQPPTHPDIRELWVDTQPLLPLCYNLCYSHQRTLTYVNSGLTHRARLLGRVQGVVVQATRLAP